MAEYEYKVIAAPTKGVKAKGLRSAEARFCHALESRMNELAAEGWEYQRAEALPSVERVGLRSSKTTWHNLLVFRRPLAPATTGLAEADAPPVSTPEPATPAPAETAEATAADESGDKPREAEAAAPDEPESASAAALDVEEARRL